MYGICLAWIMPFLLGGFFTPHFEIEADVSFAARRIHGVLSMDKGAEERLHFSIYPNRLEKPPKNINDLNKFRIYPIRFDPGWMSIDGVLCGKRHLAFAFHPLADTRRGRLEVFDDQAVPCRLRIRFSVKIPERYGPFGCIGGNCSLAAPWYPVPMPDADTRFAPIWPHRVLVRSPGTFFMAGVHRNVGQAEGNSFFFPVFSGRNWTCRDNVCFWHISPLQTWTDLITGNRAGDVLDLAHAFIRRHFPDFRQTLVLVEADLREELAMALPGRVVLAAKDALRVLDIEYFQTFHRQKLELTIAETLFLDRLTGREHPADLAWTPLMLAHGFLSRPRSVDTLLRPLKWIPQIDVMRKNPRMDFQDAYLPGPHNADRFRDDFRRWNNDLPRGEEVYHRLLDEFGAIETQAILEKYRANRMPFRELLARHAGGSMDGFFERWVDRRQPVSLSIGRVKRDPQKAGRYLVEIWQNPPARTPVEVEIRTARGTTHTVRADLSQAVHTLRVDLDSPPDRIEIDPRRRVLEPEGQGALYADHDNVWPDPGWRFIFSGFDALFNITELWSRLAVDVDFLPDRSLRRRINILALRNEYTAGGLALAHLYYFGPRINNSRLVYRWDFGVEGDRTHPLSGDGAEPASRAWLASIFSRWVVNDRVDHMFPSTGGWGILELRHSWFLPDNPEWDKTRQLRVTGMYTRYFGLALGMTAALQAQSGFLHGAIHHDMEMLHLTGPGLVQGHPANAFPGRAFALGAGELRHVLLPRLDLTLGSLVYVTRVTAAFYAGGGFIAGTAESSWNEHLRAAAGLGAALRIHGLWFGLYEAILNIQAAVPLHPSMDWFSPVFFISLEPLL